MKSFFVMYFRTEGYWRACCVWINPWWSLALGSWLHNCVQVINPSVLLIKWFPFILSDFQSFSQYFRYVMSPPIRPVGHGKALQDALSTGILQVSFLAVHKLENCM